MNYDELYLNHNVNFTNIRYNIDSIVSKLKTSNKDEMKEIITNQHNIIFCYDNLMNGNREGIQELFTSIDFLTVMDNISGSLVNNLINSEIIFINKIIYDYFEYTKSFNNTNEIITIKDKLLSISYSINFSMIRSFVPILGVNKSRLLAIISNSSYKSEKIVHRVNNFIMNIGDLNIKDIYTLFFIIYGPPLIDNIDKFNEKTQTINNKFVDMFCYSMFEYCDTSDSNISQEMIDSFNNISNVLIEKLIEISVPIDNIVIQRVLLNYYNMIFIMNIDRSKLRFSIKEHIPREANSLLEAISRIEKINNIEIY